jgi:hypothetical protein
MSVGTLYSIAARTTALDSIGGNSFDSTIPGLLQQAIVAVGNNGGGGGGGSSAWGAITGTLSNQADLQTALNAKANLASPTFTGTVTTAQLTTIGRMDVFGTGIVGGGWTVWDADNTNWVRILAPSSIASNVNINLPVTAGTLVSTGDDGTVTDTMLAGSIAPSKITGTAAILGENTFTALQQFSGSTHAGLRLNNLTTSQRDALTGSAGMVIWNTTAARLQLHNGSNWTAGMVRLDGDTMTGALAITQGTANTGVFSSTGYSLTGSNATSMIDLAGTWNTTGNPVGIRLNINNTASGTTSQLIDLQTGGSSRFAVTPAGTMRLGNVAGSLFIIPNIGGPGRVAFSSIDSGNASWLFADATRVTLSSAASLGWSPNTNATDSPDTTLNRRAAAHLGLGAASATPVAQTLGGAQGSGTNITGGALNIGTRGTGTGTGGVINFQSHAAGSSGSTLGTLATVMSISSATLVTLASGVDLQLGNAATTGLSAGALAALTNASITLKDSTGQTYRIPCII